MNICPPPALVLDELDHHCFGMFALRTFKRPLIVVGLIGWLDAREPHSASTFWARWLLLRPFVRVRSVRLRHSHPSNKQAGARFVSQPPTPRSEPLSMMCGRCSQPAEESIRERPETRQRRGMSKWPAILNERPGTNAGPFPCVEYASDVQAASAFWLTALSAISVRVASVFFSSARV